MMLLGAGLAQNICGKISAITPGLSDMNIRQGN